MVHQRRFTYRGLQWIPWAVIACLAATGGCGTTRTSSTSRTGTEQLLISDAIDRTVQSINFNKLAGQSVFLDERHLYAIVDEGYLISSLRQHLLASGCILKDKREQADFVVEPRAGAIGTDNDELLFGIPATNMPQLTLLAAAPSSLPEIPLIKRRHQRGVAKLAVFAYRRETGAPIWQSGIATNESSSNDVWFLGAGPFKRGTIHKGTSYAHQKYLLQGIGPSAQPDLQVVGIGQEAYFGGNSPGTGGGSAAAYVATAPQPRGNSPASTSAANKPSSDAGPPIFPPPTQSR